MIAGSLTLSTTNESPILSSTKTNHPIQPCSKSRYVETLYLKVLFTTLFLNNVLELLP